MIDDRNIRTSANFQERTITLPIPRTLTNPVSETLVMTLGGQKTATASVYCYNVIAMRITNIEFSGTPGGVQGTATADVLDDGVSLLTGAVDISAAAAGAKSAGTLSTAAGVTVAAGSKIAFTLTLADGTSPTWDDLTATITYTPVVATVAGVYTFYNETDWIVTAASASMSAKSGTLTTANVDVKDDGTTIFSTKPVLNGTAGAKAAGILTTTTGVTVAPGSKITVDFNITHTNGTITDAALHLTYRTKAGSEVTSTEAP